MRTILGRNSRAVVLNRERVPACDRLDGDIHGATVRHVADRVHEQVFEKTFEVAAVRNDPDITRLLSRTEIDQLFDIKHALRHTETIIERALSNSSKP